MNTNISKYYFVNFQKWAIEEIKTHYYNLYTCLDT